MRTVHSEANAIAFAAKRGISIEGASAYITHSPCSACAKLLRSSGIARVYYSTPFRETAHLKDLGLDVVHIPYEKDQNPT